MITPLTKNPPHLQEGVQDFGIFKAIFMAGSPGSGKSTVRRELFGGLGLKMVDADEVRAAYQKLGKGGDYEVYGDVALKQRTTYMDARLGIIMDTTAWWLPTIQQTTHALRMLGYDVGMVQVFTPLHTALERVQKRAEITGRQVPEPEVIKRYKGLQDHTRDYIQMLGDAYWFVDNSGIQPKLDHIRGDVREWLQRTPESPQAKAWIQAQKRRLN